MKKIALWICLMLLGSATGFAQLEVVEVTSVSIKSQAQPEKPEDNGNMDLYIRLRNKDPRKVSNLTLEICYYSKNEMLHQKSVIKHALPEGIPPDQEKGYVIHLARYNKTLFGSLDLKSQGQYPYGREAEVDGVKIIAKDLRYQWS